MIESDIVFSSSFDEKTCEQYCVSTKKKSSRLCNACGYPKVAHLLAVADHNNSKDQLDSENGDESNISSMVLLTQLFCDLRNLRMVVTNLFHWPAAEVNGMLPRLISLLADSLFAIEEVTDVVDMEQLIEAGEELVGYFEPTSDHNNVVEFISALDDVYYRLFYSVSLTWRSDDESRRHPCPIPMPHVYFTTYLIDEKTINRRLERVFLHNFTPQYKSHITRVFGLRESMKGNPLLSLHFSRWRESVCLLHTIPGVIHSVTSDWGVDTDLSPLLQRCLLPPLYSDDQPGGVEASMKPANDPLLPPLLRVWNDSCRTWSCHLYAYATPSPEALDTLAAHGPLVEIGAGTGYWTHMLRQRHPKLDISAYDVAPPTHSDSSQENTYHGRAKSWTSVTKGGVDRLKRHGDFTLFLCYPPPDNDMSVQALSSYTGSTICYVGEYRGDTGTARFESLLESTFQCVAQVPLPNWGDTCYELTVWRRLTLSAGDDFSGLSERHPSRCTVCGVLKKKMYRCRLTYSVTFCSNVCAAAGRDIHLDELTYKHLVFNPGLKQAQVETALPPAPSLKRKRKADGVEMVEGSGHPLFSVKAQYFSTLKIKCPWL